MPSPHLSAMGLPPSPHNGPGAATSRPPLMKRHSSQQSHGSGKHGIISPSSAGEHHQPLRHHVKPVRKTKIVLPRNGSSARNLAKLGRHGSEQYGEGKRHGRQKSQDENAGGEGIRLPGSLDDSRPAMRRNLTSSNLPRNTSHTKLKKNLSHGQLARIGSGKNLQGMTAAKGPPSPGFKGKRKKKSVDAGYPEKDLHEQEVEIARQQQAAKEGPRRVGFAVGDGNESSEDEDRLQMEGSGLQEDEWTDQSASASPATTRQNTANNSRRPSITADKDKPPDRGQLKGPDVQVHQPHYQQVQPATQVQRQEPAPVQPAVRPPAPEADGTPPDSDNSETEDDEENPASPRSAPRSHKTKATDFAPLNEPVRTQPTPAFQQSTTQKSALHGAKEHANPFTKQLLNRSTHHAAPALVSNVSAMDESRSARGSPAASMRSSRSNVADQPPDQEGELVSRFIPSTSHPATSSGANTTINTPKIGSYQTPESESSLVAQHPEHRERRTPTPRQPTSPGSTISGSSGATTPAMLRSRTELRMANERAMAEIEGSGKPQLMIPAHRFDRRNESLKSYLNVAVLAGDGRGGFSRESGAAYGPEIFEGRFKAVNTELKVVQRFRDPLSECLTRLQKCEGSKYKELRAQKTQKKADKMPISKSTVGLSADASKMSASASPAKSAMLASKSATNMARGGGSHGRAASGRVKFSTSPPESKESGRGGGGNEGLLGADAIARQLWDAASGKP